MSASGELRGLRKLIGLRLFPRQKFCDAVDEMVILYSAEDFHPGNGEQSNPFGSEINVSVCLSNAD